MPLPLQGPEPQPKAPEEVQFLLEEKKQEMDEDVDGSGAPSAYLLYTHYQALGLADADAFLLSDAGVTADAAGTNPRSVLGFVSAALHHGLDDIDERLLSAGGDPNLAWEEWAEEETC